MTSSPNRDKPVSPKQVQAAIEGTLNILQALVVRNDFNRICARTGWTIEMLFHEGDTLAVRERAWKVVDLFCQAVGPEKLAYWWDRQPVALTSPTGQKRIAEDKHSTLDNPSGYVMFFNLASGSPKPPEQWENNAQEFRLRCRIKNTQTMWLNNDPTRSGPNMSYIRMALPVSWLIQQPPSRSAGWLTSRAVELMQPFWCTAGWGIMPAVEERNIGPDGGGQQALYPYLKRFPGLNAIGQLTLMGRTFNDAMHSVNWLNYISDPLLERLGGREHVREQVKASQHLHAADVGNCLGIRAGIFPWLGDAEHDVTLPAFGEAARLLRPIRVKSYKNNFVAPPPSGSNDEQAQHLACDAYLGRFDYY